MLFHHQRTIKHSVRCTGTGLHSGNDVCMELLPATPGTGIVFERMDVSDKNNRIPARFDRVSDTMLCTTLTNEAGISISTVEHVMAALSGLGVDNVLIRVNGAEVPIMDGSSEPFIFLIECAGVLEQDALRPYVRIRKPIRVEQGEGWASLTPHDGFSMQVSIAFDHAVVNSQNAKVDFSRSNFKSSLSRARTFGFEEDVTRMQQMGLARGGSLDNAVVVGKDSILNEGGLRYSDEFVRHKMLDCVGDLYLAGTQILGSFDGHRTGHALNNQLLHALFADTSAWERVSAGMLPASITMPPMVGPQHVAAVPAVAALQ